MAVKYQNEMVIAVGSVAIEAVPENLKRSGAYMQNIGQNRVWFSFANGCRPNSCFYLDPGGSLNFESANVTPSNSIYMCCDSGKTSTVMFMQGYEVGN